MVWTMMGTPAAAAASSDARSGFAREDPRLRGVRVHYVRAESGEFALECAIRLPVLEGVDRAPKRVENHDPVSSRSCASQQLTLDSEGRARDERHVVSAGVQRLARENGVLLCPSEYQSRDDMTDLHIR